ncbi:MULTISPECIES: hypothetical protein [unclassified Motilimonas]|uniref:hypothetical protein n=1 Tax=unclassified Motilimonas TaxID=2643697 RepID=UPI001E457316|nr:MULTISPECIES: hypothetical protein [unclassified Motilimonas]MCE0557940.1 hypothetical protein [Motilimonas sp. E26]MDO6524744.1 hypothetical protein [Motilimonas sp. 1_MG-2023]
MNHPKVGAFLLFWLVLFISGCSDKLAEAIDANTRVAKLRLNTLASELDAGQVRNATLLKQYAVLLKQQKPDYGPLIDELAKDATTAGPMFTGLQKRLKQAVDSPQNFVSKEEQLAELENIIEAANPDLFSDALSDPINVLADMSDGKLARVNAVSKQSSLQANGAQDFGDGSQLVGNPNYGQWSQNSNGVSFWEWYGMYALFSNLTRPVLYDSWSRGRDYSYYNDYGRSRYTSPKQYKAQEQQVARTAKKFGNNNSKFSSPYAKSRTGSSQVSSASQKAKATTGFASRSSYSNAKSKSSSTTSNSSSFRTNRNTSSRSPSRGK